jgi:hypothetical protein
MQFVLGTQDRQLLAVVLGQRRRRRDAVLGLLWRLQGAQLLTCLGDQRLHRGIDVDDWRRGVRD